MSEPSRRTLLRRAGWTGLGALLTPSVIEVRAQDPVARPSHPTAQEPVLHEHDRWLQGLTAPHRQLIDVTQPAATSAFNYALTFLYANVEAYRRVDRDVNVVIVLRDRASVLALSDALWLDYRIGEFFGVQDPALKSPATRNIHAKRGTENANLSAAIDALQARGVVVAACATALRTHAAQTARKAGLDPAAARTAWLAGLLPGVVPVPAGIIAVNAAQQRGFAYASAGG